MVVRIRLARFGRAHNAFYNIVVANARTARNSKPLEVLGTYSPYPKPPPDGEGPKQKSIQLDLTRAKYWLGVGAQPTDGAWDLLHKAGLLPMKLHKQKSIWRAQKMDEIYLAIEKGEMTVEQMLERVPLLDEEFTLELRETAQREEAARKAREDASLDLGIEEDFSRQRKRPDTTPATFNDQTPRQRVRQTREKLHINADLPGKFSIRSGLDSTVSS